MGPSGLNQDFLFMWITHLLLTWVQACAVTQGRTRVGNETSTPLFKWRVMQSRTGTSALSVLLVHSKLGEISFPLQTDLILDYCVIPFCTCFISQPLSAFLSHVARVWVCNQVCASPVSPIYTVDGHYFGAWQTINHIVHDTGKKSSDVNMPFGCCNWGW